MPGQKRWAGDGLDEAWYNPVDLWNAGKKKMVNLGGGYTRDQLNATRQNAIKMGATSGRKSAEQAIANEPFSKSLERTAGKGFKAAGKKLGAAGEYASEKAGQMSKGLRQGMEDNPAGMAAAAGGALLGGWALSKLRKKRQAPV